MAHRKVALIAVTPAAICVLALIATASRATVSASGGIASTPHDVKPVDRVRREVRMLDDIYKGAIVTITQHYVNDKDTIPAGTAFKKLFVAAESKGWHRVRLIDATGEPYSDENVAEDAFEKRAIKALVGGKSWFEEEETLEGVKHLRVATPVPVVFDKCVMCHDNYANVPKGKAIGALTYTLPIDGKLMTKLAKQERAKEEGAKAEK